MSAPCPTFAFVVSVQSSGDASLANAIITEFLTLLERNALAAERRGPSEFVVRREGSQATHADRELVQEWSQRFNGGATITVGDIIELGHV